MAEANLLTQLCSICHTNAPKYCCPRCNTKTCSLKCVQRHKQWASCSGKRDPAAKVPKSELATPAAFDRDYNFLIGVEKYLDNANHRNQEIQSIEDSASMRSSKVSDFARAHNLRILRAPNGMSRQLTNSTRYNHANHCVSWAVEIIHADGSKELTHGNEGEKISHVYAELKRRGPRPPWNPPHKRKREEDAKISTEDARCPPKHAMTTSMAPILASRKGGPQVEPNTRLQVTESTASSDGFKRSLVSTDPCDMYLVKPFTSGAARVLIPVEEQMTLAACLRNQTILEYPTFQVLPKGTAPASKELILEADYEAKEKELAAEMEQELAPLELEARELQQRRDADLEGSFNDAKILASIQRDFGTDG